MGGRSSTQKPLETSSRLRKTLHRLMTIELGVILGMLAGLLVAVVFYVHYSAVVRWAFFVLLLMVGGWLAARFVYFQVSAVPPLKERDLTSRPNVGSLRSLRSVLIRANRGLKYSQLSFAISLRNSFLERLRAETGEEVRPHVLLRGSSEVRRSIGDDEIYRFLRRVTRLESRLQYVVNSDEGILRIGSYSYDEGIEAMLRRMEAWP